MAISGGTATEVNLYAKKYGISRKEASDILNVTFPVAKTAVLTDAGSHVGSLAFTGWEGEVDIDWGDGTAHTRAGAGTTPKTHTYVAGTYTVKVTGSGAYKAAAAQAIA